MNDRTRHRRLRPVRPTPELLEDRRLPAALAPIANLTVPSQQGYELPLDGSGAADDQTFTIKQTSGSPDISASIAQGPFWTINVQYTDPTNSSQQLQRAARLPALLATDAEYGQRDRAVHERRLFHQQGLHPHRHRLPRGDRLHPPGRDDRRTERGAAAAGTPFLNENVQQLAFTGTYQLAMANAGVNPSLPDYTQGVNTNDTQFFITTGSPNQVLGYGYTIFGQMVAGQDVIAKMTQVPLVDGSEPEHASQPSITQPANPLVMTSLSLSTTNPSGVAIIDTSQARPGDTATFQVTATDATRLRQPDVHRDRRPLRDRE